ncbi:MAG: protein translocase subunit SecD [Peptococcaceae bacterium]|nr:protein translocase subunit SecD [Peptococcaceae bacterium]
MNKLNVLKLAAVVIVVGALAFFSYQYLGNPESRFLGVDLSLPLGLDLRGGVHLALEAKEKADGTPVTEDDLKKARTVIERRVNSLGVSEPSIQLDTARNRIIVEIAGTTDPEKAVEILRATAKLTFRYDTLETVTSDVFQRGVDVKNEAAVRVENNIVMFDAIENGITQAKVLERGNVRDESGTVFRVEQGRVTDKLISSDILMDGEYLNKASAAATDPTQGRSAYVVNFEFNTAGAGLFGDITTKYLNKKISIYLDEEFLQAPLVNQPILQGQGEITGYATKAEAAEMAALIESGALPVSMEIMEKQQVGAQLGADSMNKSLMACLVALILIIVFMVIYYRLQGVVASFALVMFAIIVLWVLKAFGVVLTLTGIAGFVLAVAMAVDLNIIVFERIKEEIAFGKSLRAAVDAGFSRAFLTVFDSNITTIFAALALLVIGSSSIRGFAVTLIIGIVVSLFTAVTFTRLIMRWVVGVNHKLNTWWLGVRRRREA